MDIVASLPARPEPMAGLAVVALVEHHVGDAARLFAAGFERQADRVPALPARHREPAEIAPLLARAVRAGGGVAAVRGDELAGFMTVLEVPGLRGSGPAAYVPEWGHGAAGPDRTAVFFAMYTALAGRWAELGRAVHCVTVLASDDELQQALIGLGFGLFVVDAVRPTAGQAFVEPPAGVSIRRATAADAGTIEPLAIDHEAYYAQSPVFLHRPPLADPLEAVRGWLAEPGATLWIAREGAVALAFVQLRPPGDDGCAIVRDPATIGIGPTFVGEGARGRGIGGALLSEAIRDAADRGFVRVAVDFESANLPARRFWLRTFTPICLSFERHLDDRLVQPSGARP